MAKRLQTFTFWFLWLSTWDDEIDQSTSELFNSLENANKFREESFHYVRYCTGVPTEETYKFRFDINPPTHKLIRSLDVIGANLQEVYTKGGARPLSSDQSSSAPTPPQIWHNFSRSDHVLRQRN